ncbi:hypothetical protein EDC02_5939 [Micromonospora sp. Llam0]|uniref:hypothetical protein n=1 Tax=Micromonospora sp. Llam0 TaxID=2485143 RepID=UPI000F498617|nr:hypothetical protein [Micromonospora sp. Llam0]ROO51075.1 hypothetical protein EDC02_5939 [Micromonospora sp. Llam0]
MTTWAEFIDAEIPQPATITVEAFAGAGAHGPVYSAAVQVTDCVVDDTSRLVRVQTQDAAGSEKVSKTTVLCPPGTSAPAGSRVTLPSGRVTRVLVVAELDDHGLDLPSHVELSLE